MSLAHANRRAIAVASRRESRPRAAAPRQCAAPSMRAAALQVPRGALLSPSHRRCSHSLPVIGRHAPSSCRLQQMSRLLALVCCRPSPRGASARVRLNCRLASPSRSGASCNNSRQFSHFLEERATSLSTQIYRQCDSTSAARNSRQMQSASAATTTSPLETDENDETSASSLDTNVQRSASATNWPIC